MPGRQFRISTAVGEELGSRVVGGGAGEVVGRATVHAGYQPVAQRDFLQGIGDFYGGVCAFAAHDCATEIAERITEGFFAVVAIEFRSEGDNLVTGTNGRMCQAGGIELVTHRIDDMLTGAGGKIGQLVISLPVGDNTRCAEERHYFASGHRGQGSRSHLRMQRDDTEFWLTVGPADNHDAVTRINQIGVFNIGIPVPDLWPVPGIFEEMCGNAPEGVTGFDGITVFTA